MAGFRRGTLIEAIAAQADSQHDYAEQLSRFIDEVVAGADEARQRSQSGLELGRRLRTASDQFIRSTSAFLLPGSAGPSSTA